MLNDEQKEAVLTRDVPLLILAGPGTGKTETIAHRIAALIGEGEDPEKILAITFTNKASQAMRDRVLSLTGKRLSWIRTIHGTCAQLLRSHIHKLGYNTAFNIASMEQSNKILKDCIREIGLNEALLDIRELAGTIARIKSKAKPEEQLASESHPFPEIFNAYQEKMRSQGCIDFNDLIYLCLKLLKEDPNTLAEARDQWRHIIIDEFQDSDPAQYQLISHLGRERGIAVVGDDDQSIYSFRSSTPEVIALFVADFSPKIITLKKSYRLPRILLEAASSLIRNNLKRFEKELVCAQEAEGHLEVRGFGSETEEGDFVAQEVLALQAQGVPSDEIAVLGRRHAPLAIVEASLKKMNIPCRKMGERSFYELREVRDMMALITAVALPENSPALERIFKLTPGITARAIDLLEDIAEQNEVSLYRAAELAIEHQYLQGEASKSLQEALTRLDQLRPRMEQLCISDLMRAAAKEFDYLSHLQKISRGPSDYEKRLGHLKDLAQMADQFELSSGPSLTNFINEMAISAIQGGTPKEKGGIRLITLHGAKGLEFRVVFLIGAFQGNIPHVKGNLEEERRLMFVGVTRAKERLYITHARYIQNEVRQRSYFVDEMGRMLSPKSQV
ncbi:ATP-dependent helicase [Candidatus Manganitrophus noduliformans]|uniref:ATP-dependent helicase n=1 Tax=Candidatus Manganitrophus noduliformans TaxID=2606439 RepID=UPI00143ACFB3|nr:ATP-dependent helicase [Candidatus Manganitrophus noduliformans]